MMLMVDIGHLVEFPTGLLVVDDFFTCLGRFKGKKMNGAWACVCMFVCVDECMYVCIMGVRRG